MNLKLQAASRKSNPSINNLSNLGKFLYYHVQEVIDLSQGKLVDCSQNKINENKTKKVSTHSSKQGLSLIRSEDDTILYDHPAKHLLLQNNKTDNLIKDISMLKNQFAFPNLIELVLNENNILSVEALHRVSFPSLKQLDLNDNKIVEGKSLRKIICPELQWLMISKDKVNEGENCMQDLSWMTQLWAPNLQALTLERLQYQMIQFY